MLKLELRDCGPNPGPPGPGGSSLDRGKFVSLPPPKPMRENWPKTPLSLFRGLSMVPLLPVVSWNEWVLGLRGPMLGPFGPVSLSGSMIGGIL